MRLSQSTAPAPLLAQATASALAEYYVEGPYWVPPPAKAALSARLISSADMTVVELAARAYLRIGELAAAAESVGALPVVNQTLAGAPIAYNYVSWAGGSSAYQTCDLSRCGCEYLRSAQLYM